MSLLEVLGMAAPQIGGALDDLYDRRRQAEADARARQEEALRRRQLEQQMTLAAAAEARAVEDQARQQREAERRELGSTIDTLRTAGAGMTEAGDYGGAARQSGRLQQLLGQYTGGPAGPGIVGGVREVTREAPRPAPSFQGPMPGVTKRETFFGADSQKALRGLYGVKPPAPRVTPFGRGGLAQVLLGEGGVPEVKILRDPDPATTGLALTDNGDGTATYVPKTAGTTVRRPPKKGRGGGAPKQKMGWINDGKGGKVWGPINAGTVNPANPRAGATPKPLTYAQALDTARKEVGGGSFTTPTQQAQIVARAKQLQRESQGGDELDAWLASKRKGK